MYTIKKVDYDPLGHILMDATRINAGDINCLVAEVRWVKPQSNRDASTITL